MWVNKDEREPIKPGKYIIKTDKREHVDATFDGKVWQHKSPPPYCGSSGFAEKMIAWWDGDTPRNYRETNVLSAESVIKEMVEMDIDMDLLLL